MYAAGKPKVDGVTNENVSILPLLSGIPAELDHFRSNRVCEIGNHLFSESIVKIAI